MLVKLKAHLLIQCVNIFRQVLRFSRLFRPQYIHHIYKKKKKKKTGEEEGKDKEAAKAEGDSIIHKVAYGCLCTSQIRTFLVY